MRSPKDRSLLKSDSFTPSLVSLHNNSTWHERFIVIHHFCDTTLFFASRVLLKSNRRIMALVMIMGLYLLVYNLGQRQLRQTLAAAEATLPQQKGKPTSRPTLRWILQCFQSVHLVWLNGSQYLIRLNHRQQLIFQFLSLHSQKYYLLPSDT